jgi:hypothetical protein
MSPPAGFLAPDRGELARFYDDELTKKRNDLRFKIATPASLLRIQVQPMELQCGIRQPGLQQARSAW